MGDVPDDVVLLERALERMQDRHDPEGVLLGGEPQLPSPLPAGRSAGESGEQWRAPPDDDSHVETTCCGCDT